MPVPRISPKLTTEATLATIAAVALLAAGCRDALSPPHAGPAAFVEAGPEAAQVTGLGAIGSGSATRGGGRQEFDFDATAAPGGTLSYKDWSFVRPDGSVPSVTVDPVTDPATAITSFTQTSAACVTFGGTARVSDTQELFAFTVAACDNGSPGARRDSFAINVPPQPGAIEGYTRSGIVTEGDITLAGGTPPPSAGTEITGLGAIGSGGDRQDFDFDATDAPGGTLSYQDWSFVRSDGSVPSVTVDPTTDPATSITSFTQTSAACVTFGGTARVSDTQELLDFTIAACDNGSPGAGSDSFAINVPPQPGVVEGYARSGILTEGDITLGGPGATTGDLTVTTSTTGSSLPAGYTLSASGPGGSTTQTIGANATVTFSAIPPGDYAVTLADVPANCTVGGSTSRTVTVPSGGTGSTTFSVTCTTPPGDLTVTTSTSGSSLPNGYTVTVDGSMSQAIGTSSSVTFTNLSAGSHAVVLSNVPVNCTVGGGTSRTVTVPSGGTATVSYSVSCTTPNRAPSVNAGPNETVLLGLLYSLNWSFSDPDNDGPWSYTINWGDGSSTSGSTWTQGSQSTGHTYLLVGSYTIRVTVRDSHGATGSASKTLTVLIKIGL